MYDVLLDVVDVDFSVVQLVYKFYLPLARLLCACSSLFPCRVRAYQYSVEIPRLILFLLWDVRLTLPFCSSIPRRRFFYFVQNRIRQKFNKIQGFFSNFFSHLTKVTNISLRRNDSDFLLIHDNKISGSDFSIFFFLFLIPNFLNNDFTLTKPLLQRVHLLSIVLFIPLSQSSR